MYNPADENIHILFKDGAVKDISQVDNALIQHNLKGAVKNIIFVTRGFKVVQKSTSFLNRIRA